MVWYSHLSKNFPQFVLIQTVKSFSIVNEIMIDFFFFLKIPCFLYNPANVGNFTSSFPSFTKPRLGILKFLVNIMLKLGMQDLSMAILAWEMSATVRWLAHSLVLPVLGTRMRIDLFPVLWLLLGLPDLLT